MSHSLRPHGLQHPRLPCPLLSPRVCSDSWSTELMMPSNHLILCHPLLLLPSIFPSIRVFLNKSALCSRWPKYWSFSYSPSNEYSGLISFRIDWFDLLAAQGTLKRLFQHHSLTNSLVLSFLYSLTLTSIHDFRKASILWRSVFFMVQLSHSYMTTVKTIALTRWTFRIHLSVQDT